MTDHPSNPPSQTKGQEIASEICIPPAGRRYVAEQIDSALAAQEARHQEQREVDAAAIRLSLGMLAVEEARHKAEMAMGGSYEVALAAAFEAVKVLADYPPEQETPKPEPCPARSPYGDQCRYELGHSGVHAASAPPSPRRW